jgi:uncharacterized membrane protein YczE
VGSSDRQGVPLSPIHHPPSTRRLVRLYSGLALYGTSDALLIRGDLGLDPWDVLHQGLSRHTGISIGAISIVLGAAVLLLWWPLRQRPGLGTISNVFLVGAFLDLTLAVVPPREALAVRIPLLLAGVLLNGAATGLYITARFGPGPRDGLMTGLHRRTGRSLRLIRSGIELTVLAVGYLLGGGVGIGTVLYAVAIGPLAQFFLRRFDSGFDNGSGRVVSGSVVVVQEAPEPGRPGRVDPI